MSDLAYDLLSAIGDYNPDKVGRKVHCSNCLACKAKGEWPQMIAIYHEGHGSVELIKLLRERQPTTIRAAKSCPDFSSMSDEPVKKEVVKKLTLDELWQMTESEQRKVYGDRIPRL